MPVEHRVLFWSNIQVLVGCACISLHVHTIQTLLEALFLFLYTETTDHRYADVNFSR